MKTKLFKNLLASLVLIFVMAPVLALPVMAQNIGLNYAENIGLSGTNMNPQEAAVSIIKYLMTFLGIIAVAVILLGGFRWLTAGGNEDKIASAKNTIIAGVIGLIIVLAAYAIVQFIVSTTTNIITNGTP